MGRVTTGYAKDGGPVKLEPEKVGRRMYVGTAGLYLAFVAPLYRTAGDMKVIELASVRGGGDDAA